MCYLQRNAFQTPQTRIKRTLYYPNLRRWIRPFEMELLVATAEVLERNFTIYLSSPIQIVHGVTLHRWPEFSLTLLASLTSSHTSCTCIFHLAFDGDVKFVCVAVEEYVLMPVVVPTLSYLYKDEFDGRGINGCPTNELALNCCDCVGCWVTIEA